MSMPPETPERFAIYGTFGQYKIVMLDEHGVYRTLCVLEREYNWLGAAEVLLDALLSVNPSILPVPNDKQ